MRTDVVQQAAGFGVGCLLVAVVFYVLGLPQWRGAILGAVGMPVARLLLAALDMPPPWLLPAAPSAVAGTLLLAAGWWLRWRYHRGHDSLLVGLVAELSFWLGMVGLTIPAWHWVVR